MADMPEKKNAFDDGTGWYTNLKDFMSHLFAAKDAAYWCCDHDVKYLNLRIDTRDNAYRLYADGRGDASNMQNKFDIPPQKVLDAIDTWFERFKTERPTADTTPELRTLPQLDLIKVIEGLISDTEWQPATEHELRGIQETVAVALSDMFERVEREELDKFQECPNGCSSAGEVWNGESLSVCPVCKGNTVVESIRD